MVKVKFEGKTELEKQIRRLMLESDADNLASKLYSVAADAAKLVSDSIRSSAQNKKVPHQIQDDIFHTEKPKPYATSGKRAITQLAGIRLRGRQKPYAKAYREWRARHSMTKIRIHKRKGTVVNRGTVNAGQLIGMSLATMFEFGTSKMSPRPFFKPGINAARSKVKETLIAGFRNLLEEHTK